MDVDLTSDDENFKHLVNFYEEFLRRLQKGEDVMNLLKPGERGKLRYVGILDYRHRTWVVTEKAKQTLRKIVPEELNKVIRWMKET